MTKNETPAMASMAECHADEFRMEKIKSMAGDFAHYEFHRWEEMFKAFYERKSREPELQLIISTYPCTEGYWWEVPPIDIRDGEYIYATLESVQQLEQRVIARVTECKKYLLPTGLIL